MDVHVFLYSICEGLKLQPFNCTTNSYLQTSMLLSNPISMEQTERKHLIKGEGQSLWQQENYSIVLPHKGQFLVNAHVEMSKIPFQRIVEQEATLWYTDTAAPALSLASTNCLPQLSDLFNSPKAAHFIWQMTTICWCLEMLDRAAVPGCPCMSAAGWWRCRLRGTPRCPAAVGCGSARQPAPCQCTAPEPCGSHSESSHGNTGCERRT